MNEKKTKTYIQNNTLIVANEHAIRLLKYDALLFYGNLCMRRTSNDTESFIYTILKNRLMVINNILCLI